MEGKKRCSKCLEEKTKEEFHFNRSTKDGLERWCKECKRKSQQSLRDRKARRTPARTKRFQKSAVKNINNIKKQEIFNKSKKTGSTAIKHSTPEQIILELRRGLAIEIILMIQEKYGI